MKELIIEILTPHPEGMLGATIKAIVTGRMRVDADDVEGTLNDMLRAHEIVTKPRVFRYGDPGDGDSLYALPSSKVVKIAPNKNPNMTK